MKIVELPDGSEGKSYYKYMRVPLEPVGPEEVERLTHLAQDPALALEFKDRAKLQSADFEPEPEGSYILPDGTIVISTCVDVPNMTGESLDWWMVWHQLDPLRYALWNPEDHHDLSVDDEARRRYLDGSIPVEERIWGTVSHVSESMNGEDPDGIDIVFVSPGEHGYDWSLHGTERCMAIAVSNGTQKFGPLEIPVFMTELIRKDKEGNTKWYGHWWIGHGYKDSKETCVKIPRPLRKTAAEKASMLIVHNHKEVRHLDKFIADLYAENKDNWLE